MRGSSTTSTTASGSPHIAAKLIGKVSMRDTRFCVIATGPKCCRSPANHGRRDFKCEEELKRRWKEEKQWKIALREKAFWTGPSRHSHVHTHASARTRNPNADGQEVLDNDGRRNLCQKSQPTCVMIQRVITRNIMPDFQLMIVLMDIVGTWVTHISGAVGH